MTKIIRLRRLRLMAPLAIAACTTSPEQDPMTAQAADIAELRQEISRRDREMAQLEQDLNALRRDVETLRTALADPGDQVAVAATAPAPEKPAHAPQTAATPAEPAEGEFAVHLASYGSAALAAESWAELARRHPDLLAGLEPRLTTLSIDDTVYYRLIAGRFDSHDTASQACGRIEPATGYCIVTFFGGEALP